MIARRICILTVVVAACSSPSGRASRGATQQDQALPSDTTNVCAPLSPDSARTRYWAYVSRIVDHGSTRARLAAYLGAPLATRIDTMRPSEDRMPTDTVATLQFRGFSVAYILYGEATEALSFIQVSDSTTHLPLPIGIGASGPALRRCFGAPNVESQVGDSTLVQFPVGETEFGPDQIVFFLAGGVVRKVAWSLASD